MLRAVTPRTEDNRATPWKSLRLRLKVAPDTALDSGLKALRVRGDLFFQIGEGSWCEAAIARTGAKGIAVFRFAPCPTSVQRPGRNPQPKPADHAASDDPE